MRNPKKARPGHIIWGHAIDSHEKPHLLYAASEGLDDSNNYDYTHAAFDINERKILYEFDDGASSDNLALDRTGTSSLPLSTLLHQLIHIAQAEG